MNMEGEFQKEQQVLLVADPASCSKLSTSSTTLDDLFFAQNTEVDVGLEWLSVFVEECFSNPPSYILGPSKSVEATTTTTTTITTCSSNKNPSSTTLLKHNNNDSSLKNFSVPCKARSKRKRLSAVTNRRRTKTPFSIWSHQNDEPLISDPPLLKQTYWLADSELFVLPKQQKKDSEKDVIAKDSDDNEDDDGEKGVVVMKRGSLVSLEECSEAEEDGDGGNNNNNNNNDNNNNGENPMPRRCTHCLAQRTPQWRAGPLGPKTLCNACGVRYKSGRLLPEYRPAKSPTFVSYLHSNSHKKVMEMRMAGSILHSWSGKS